MRKQRDNDAGWQRQANTSALIVIARNVLILIACVVWMTLVFRKEL